MLKRAVSLINSILPKRNIIIFNSFPDASGNSLALYEYILKEREDITSKYKLVWSIGGNDEEKVLNFLNNRTSKEKHHVVRKKSLHGICLYFVSKYIISTHGYFPGVKTGKNQIHINLWHGMPFKRIGRLLEEVHTNGKRDEADITISTSPEFSKIMAEAFGIDQSSVLMTGQPCNDSLFYEHNSLKKLNIDKKKYKKVVMWMPTYRKSVVGDIRIDGNADSFGVSIILAEHRNDLESHLSSLDILLLIKPHPMDVLCQQEFSQTGHIKIINNQDLEANDIVLYELLAETDVLLTDYSSVFIDYMVTGKPMAFICDDLEEYSNSRGFCFNPPRDYMPGEILSNYEQLISYLSEIEKYSKKWKTSYEMIRDELNRQKCPNACKRICDILWRV